LGYLAATVALRADFYYSPFQIYLKMTNLLKVSAAALFLAVGLTSCESKPAATETTTTPATTESTAPMATDSAATTAAPADGAMAPAAGAAADTTKKM
jgi:PBP1b-binding outer membrane lipoprotein LpoB